MRAGPSLAHRTVTEGPARAARAPGNAVPLCPGRVPKNASRASVESRGDEMDFLESRLVKTPSQMTGAPVNPAAAARTCRTPAIRRWGCRALRSPRHVQRSSARARRAPEHTLADDEAKPEEVAPAEVGDKRKADEAAAEGADDAAPDAKKEKREWTAVKLGPKTFASPEEMIKYFSWILNNMTVNQDMNDYEFMVVDECLRRHPDADKKIGAGVKTFQIRSYPGARHPMLHGRAYRRVVRRLQLQEVRGGAVPRLHERRAQRRRRRSGRSGQREGAGAGRRRTRQGWTWRPRPPLSARESHRDVCLRTTRTEAALERAPLPARFREASAPARRWKLNLSYTRPTTLRLTTKRNSSRDSYGSSRRLRRRTGVIYLLISPLPDQRSPPLFAPEPKTGAQNVSCTPHVTSAKALNPSPTAASAAASTAATGSRARRALKLPRRRRNA